MTKFNSPAARANVKSPVTSVGPARTALGGDGYLRNAKSELYLLAVSNMVGVDEFHESGADRDDRFERLVRQVAVEDFDFVRGMAPWLRDGANMRSASVALAVHTVKARIDAGLHEHNGEIVDAVCQRPDEPGELLSAWRSMYGRAIPKAVKWGLSQAVRRLYTERNVLKYDSANRGYRFADVIEAIHPMPIGGKGKDYYVCPTPQKPRFATSSAAPQTLMKGEKPLRTYFCRCGWYHSTTKLVGYEEPEVPLSTQELLFKYLLDQRHHGDGSVEGLPMLEARKRWSAASVRDKVKAIKGRDAAQLLGSAGLTWENVLSDLGSHMDKRDLWAAIAPTMGTMALIRNLRNMDEAGLPSRVVDEVARKIEDPEQVRRSKAFPFRFLAAHNAVSSLNWGKSLERALAASLANVPELGGSTLILVDRSGSMFGPQMKGTQLDRADSAALFGSALAMRAKNATLVEFGTSSREVPFRRGESVLKMVDKFTSLGGTNTTEAVRLHYRGHDRVVIITDEQAGYSFHGDPTKQVPGNIPVYTWNLAGYRVGHGPSGSSNRHTFGGLSDSSFRTISLLEGGRDGRWPWEN